MLDRNLADAWAYRGAAKVDDKGDCLPRRAVGFGSSGCPLIPNTLKRTSTAAMSGWNSGTIGEWSQTGYAIAASRPLNNPEKPLFIAGEATLTPARVNVNTTTPCGIAARPSGLIWKMRKPGATWARFITTATFIATTSDMSTRCATTAEQLTGKNHSRISATCAKKRHHHLKQGLRWAERTARRKCDCLRG